MEEWLYEFNQFKFKCKKTQNSEAVLSPEYVQNIRNKIKERLDDLKSDYIAKKHFHRKEADEMQKESTLNEKIDQIKKISLNQIEKELRLEDLLEEDELEKQELQQEELKKEIKNNQKKSEKLLLAIKESQLEEKYRLAKFNAVESIKKIQEETKKQILQRRMLVKKRISELRNINERKKSMLKEQILNLRGSMAENISRVLKKGDEESCKYSSFANQFDKIRIYCILNFKDDHVKYGDCVKEETFCGVCCENEFGDFYLTEREICNKKCKLNHENIF